MEKPSAALQAKTQKIRELQPTTITERPAYLKKNVAEKGESLTEFSHLISAEKKKKSVLHTLPAKGNGSHCGQTTVLLCSLMKQAQALCLVKKRER